MSLPLNESRIDDSNLDPRLLGMEALLRPVLLGMTGSAEDVDELFHRSQVNILLAARAGRLPTDETHFRLWCMKVAVNEVRQLRRSRSRERSFLRRLGKRMETANRSESATAPDDPALEQALHHSLRRLPDELRDPLVLHYYRNVSMAGIGEVLNTSPQAAWKRVRKGIDRLREEFRRNGHFALLVLLEERLQLPAPPPTFASAAGPSGLYGLGVLMTKSNAILMSGLLLALCLTLSVWMTQSRLSIQQPVTAETDNQTPAHAASRVSAESASVSSHPVVTESPADTTLPADNNHRDPLDWSLRPIKLDPEEVIRHFDGMYKLAGAVRLPSGLFWNTPLREALARLQATANFPLLLDPAIDDSTILVNCAWGDDTPLVSILEKIVRSLSHEEGLGRYQDCRLGTHPDVGEIHLALLSIPSWLCYMAPRIEREFPLDAWLREGGSARTVDDFAPYWESPDEVIFMYTNEDVHTNPIQELDKKDIAEAGEFGETSIEIRDGVIYVRNDITWIHTFEKFLKMILSLETSDTKNTTPFATDLPAHAGRVWTCAKLNALLKLQPQLRTETIDPPDPRRVESYLRQYLSLTGITDLRVEDPFHGEFSKPVTLHGTLQGALWSIATTLRYSVSFDYGGESFSSKPISRELPLSALLNGTLDKHAWTYASNLNDVFDESDTIFLQGPAVNNALRLIDMEKEKSQTWLYNRVRRDPQPTSDYTKFTHMDNNALLVDLPRRESWLFFRAVAALEDGAREEDIPELLRQWENLWHSEIEPIPYDTGEKK